MNDPKGQPEPEAEGLTARLVRGAQEGDDTSFATLYTNIAPAVYAWANLRLSRQMRAWLDPEEVVQEVWLRALDRFRTYDPARAPFRVWIFRIAGNTLLEMMRKVSRHLRVQPAEGGGNSTRLFQVESVPDDVTSVSRRVSRSESLKSFLETVHGMEEDEKKLLLYRGLEGLPHAEVAEKLGISVEATHKRWQRLRLRLEQSSLPAALLTDETDCH